MVRYRSRLIHRIYGLCMLGGFLSVLILAYAGWHLIIESSRNRIHLGFYAALMIVAACLGIMALRSARSMNPHLIHLLAILTASATWFVFFVLTEFFPIPLSRPSIGFLLALATVVLYGWFVRRIITRIHENKPNRKYLYMRVVIFIFSAFCFFAFHSVVIDLIPHSPIHFLPNEPAATWQRIILFAAVIFAVIVNRVGNFLVGPPKWGTF